MLKRCTDQMSFSEYEDGKHDKSLACEKIPLPKQQKGRGFYKYWLITFMSFVFNLYWKTGLPMVP